MLWILSPNRECWKIYVITHRLSLLVDFNQILVLNEGIIVEDGNHKELMEMNGIYKEMYMRQAQNYIDGMEVV